MSEHESVVVVGGMGAVGAMLVELLRNDKADVTVVDTHGSGSSVIAGDITTPDARLRILLARATMVILAVPESVALTADLTEVTADALVVETLSVKSRFAAYARSSGYRFAALGINPMFAPSLGMSGRSVAAVVHRPSASVDAFLDRIQHWGGRAVNVDADTHDRLAATTQALTHASVLSFGLALGALGMSIEDVYAVAPPPHTTALAVLARICGGEPEVYWDVQAGNPYAQDARAALVESTRRLNEVVTSGSEAEFAGLIADAGAGLGSKADSYRELCSTIFGILRGDGTDAGRRSFP